jgi:PAS domain S-box-containing protein
MTKRKEPVKQPADELPDEQQQMPELEPFKSKRIQTEKELREAEKRFRLFFNNTTDVIFSIDSSLKVHYISPSLEEKLGYRPEEFIGKSVPEVNILSPDSLERVSSDMMRLLAGEFAPARVYEFIAKDGTRKFGELVYNLVTAPDKTVSLTAVARDVTRQVQTEKALRESNEMFLMMTESVHDAFIMMGHEGDIFYWNKAAEKMFGYTREEIIGKHLHTTLAPERFYEDYLKNFKRFQKTGQGAAVGKTLELVAVRKNGTEFPIELSLSALKRKGRWNSTGVIRDITKRKEADELYKTLTEKSLIGIYIVQDGKFQFVNDNVTSYTGRTIDEIIGMNSADFLHPDDKEMTLKTAGKMLKEKNIHPYEFRIIDKNGRVRWIMETVASIEYRGRPAILGNSMDITELKEAQKELADISLLQSTILDAIPHAVLGLEKRRITFANRSVETVLGWRPEELIGKDTRVLYKNDDDYHETGGLTYPVLEAEGKCGLEISLRHRDGRDLTCMLNDTVIGKKLEDGKIVAVLEDITGRKKMEEDLKETRLLQSSILETIPHAVFGVENRRVIFANNAVEKVFGWTPEELIGGDTSKLYKNDEEYKKIGKNSYNTIAQKHRTVDREISCRYRDGHDITCRLTGDMIGDNSKGARFVGMYEDITERKKAEEERRKLENRLRHAKKMESLGALAGGVAHDLNNVLSGIVSYPELLLMQLPEDSPLRKPLTTIQKSGEKAAAIVQDMLTLARRGVAVTEVVKLNDIVSEYLQTPECEKLKSFHPGVKIETNLEENLLNIMGSPVHLSKTAMNLISNAAEAMPDGGKIIVSTQNRYISEPVKGYDDIKEGDYVTLAVFDTGIGISAGDMEKIFDPFYTKKVMGRSGTGLGMTVVWGTVKDHNGYIDVESTEGKGTTFTLYFPVTRKESVKDKSLINIEDYMGGGETVLVVDDIEEQREIASVMLKKLGYSVTSVSSGEEAIDYMKDHSADLLILDMIMDPGIDGLETYRKILELHPGQKAIIASGFSESKRVKQVQKLGSGTYVKKPYLLKKIGIAVRGELDKPRVMKNKD